MVERDAPVQRTAEQYAASNSCVNCLHEATCGYSWFALFEKRHPEFSFRPCILGNKSYSNVPFFTAKATS